VPAEPGFNRVCSRERRDPEGFAEGKHESVRPTLKHWAPSRIGKESGDFSRRGQVRLDGGTGWFLRPPSLVLRPPSSFGELRK